MKLCVFVVSLLAAVSMMAQSPAAQVQTIHSSGAFANLSAFANGSDLFLNVNRSDNNGQRTTFLNFDIFSFSNNSFSDTFGFGQIPNDSLVGDSTKRVSLNVDTRQLSSFQTVTCTFDFTTFTESCQPGPFGVIQLDFQQDGAFSTRTISDNDTKFFQFEFRNQQNSDSASASANGSVVGIPITNGFGNIGTNRDTTITLTSRQ